MGKKLKRDVGLEGALPPEASEGPTLEETPTVPKIDISVLLDNQEPVAGERVHCKIDVEPGTDLGVIFIKCVDLDVTIPNDFIIPSYDSMNGSENYEFDISTAGGEPTEGNVVLTGEKINECVVPISFIRKRKMFYTCNPADGTTYKDNAVEITITNAVYNGELEALRVTPAVGMSVTKVKDLVNGYLFSIRSKNGTPIDDYVEFEGDHLANLIVPVTFSETEVDPLDVNIETQHIDFQQGEVATVTIRDTAVDCTLTCETEGVVIEKIDINKFTITTELTGIFNLLISGVGVQETSVSIEVRDRIPFSVPVTNLTVNQVDIPYLLEIKDVRYPVKASCTNLSIISTIVEKDGRTYLEVDALDPRYTKDLTGTIRLESFNSPNIEIETTLETQREKDYMPCNGLTLMANVGMVCKFKLPPIDINDDVSVECDDLNVLINRAPNSDLVYLTAKEPGRYEILVKHTEYKDSIVRFVAKEQPVEEIPENPNEPVYDLGVVPPSIKISTITEDLVSDVFSSRQFTTDKERLAFLVQRGPEYVKKIGTQFCMYQQVMGKANKELTGVIGAKYNYSLYSTLMGILNIEDYYTFREAFKLAVKFFKVYGDDSLKDINLMRFDSYWTNGDARLEEFKLLVVFMCKYIEMNGQNVSTYGLTFKYDIMKKLIRYCTENIRP